MTDEQDKRGEQLLHAVERIIASPASIRATIRRLEEKERARVAGPPSLLQERVAQGLISHYSMATAVSGGAAGIPALFPGIGTATALVGGGLADMTLCLKFEVELILALSSLLGNDIDSPDERSYCLLLAGITTYQEMAGKNALIDAALVQGEALWQYTSRQTGKLIATVFLRLAVMALTRGALRSFPVAGILIGFAANRVLTQKVGERALADLQERAARLRAQAERGGTEVAVDAVVDEVEPPDEQD